MTAALLDHPGARGDIVYVAPYFPPDLGGMERVAEQLALGIAGRRRVTVLTSSAAEPVPEPPCYPGSLTVRRLRTVRIAQIPFMPQLARELLRTPRAALIHVHVAQAYAPEVVWLTAKATRRPYVAHFHLDVQPSTWLGPLFSLYKRLVLARVLRGASRVVALTDEQREVLQRRYGVAPHRIAVIPNGVPAGFARIRADTPAHAGPFRLLFVGRLSPQKNLPRLLEAMSRLHADVELVIVGDGPSRPVVETMVHGYALRNVRLVGAAHGDDLADWYRWADALVLTSDREGMPLVLLEAMAAGLPIVATDVPGVAATVGDAGLVVPPAPGAVAEAVERLAGDPALCAELGDRAAARAVDHGWDRVVDAMDDLYTALAG
jgi:glycosyltransferase involved in cell wall biosynthesis